MRAVFGYNLVMLIVIYVALLGLLVGSAINALVWRLHVGRSWVHGRSECPECGHQLAARDLVPVASWLLLRGKCRYCRASIKDSPIVEAGTAVLFGLSAFALSPATAWGYVELAVWLLILTMLIILAVYDARWMLLPDKVMLPTLLTVLGLLVLQAYQQGSVQGLGGPFLAALLGGGGFLTLVVVTKGRAMGGGDIKLAAVMGLLLGLQATAVAMLLAFNAAALVGVALIALHRRRRRDQIPFGPFLVLGTVTAYLYGRDLADWYLRLNGLA